ncbi:copper resistance protein B [Cobetia marina]|uniref:copper resistance protein B n=1 Tax=Cobetia marina TaxID=28258 RepID=UPI002549000D|nr:copper resistance protein B [Cobetia pacifica]MDI6002483.1 copper resistance protein B [Cobetia pacifica]
MSISHHSFRLASVTAFLFSSAGVSQAFAQDGYDAPQSWPSPMAEHLQWSAAFDRLEYSLPNKGEDSLIWDFQAWYGGDTHRVYLKSEGENTQGDGEDAEFESLGLLYSRLIADFWEFQIGGGYQGGVLSDDHDESVYGVFGLQGTAPYRIETDAAVQYREGGIVTASLELEHDIRLTQRWYLQPRSEIVLAANESRQQAIGSGLNSVRIGLRARYEVTRRVAPYVGMYWQREYGETADMRREESETVEDTGVVIGMRMMF